MASLLQSIRYRVVDDNGAPIPGAKVYTYAAGTSTPKASYTSSTAGVANANPVIADARGEVLMWLSGAYKITIKDPDDVLIDEEDNVVDLTSGGTFATPTFTGTVTYSGTTMTWSGNPTHSGNHTFSGNVTFNGNTSIGNASGDTLTIAPNAVTWTNGATHSGAHTWSGAQICSSTLAVTGATTLNGAVTLGDSAADTVTLTGTPAGLLLADSYTPTVTAVANCSAASAQTTQYCRIGNRVFGSGVVLFTVTSNTTITQLGISIPIASNFAGTGNASGTASTALLGANHGAVIYADSTNDRLTLDFTSSGTGAAVFYFTFMYQVI